MDGSERLSEDGEGRFWRKPERERGTVGGREDRHLGKAAVSNLKCMEECQRIGKHPEFYIIMPFICLILRRKRGENKNF